MPLDLGQPAEKGRRPDLFLFHQKSPGVRRPREPQGLPPRPRALFRTDLPGMLPYLPPREAAPYHRIPRSRPDPVPAEGPGISHCARDRCHDADARQRLETSGLASYFDHIVTCDHTGKKKPDPAPFLLALDLLGTGAHETLMVGDSPRRDIEPGHRLGLVTAYARYGDYSPDRSNGGAHHVLSKFSDLLDLLPLNVSGNGSGHEPGNGSVHGSRHEPGNGSVHGSGYESGPEPGNRSGYGSGHVPRNGSGYGSGYGSGNGSGPGED